MGLREAYNRKKLLKPSWKRNQDLCRVASAAHLALHTLSNTLRWLPETAERHDQECDLPARPRLPSLIADGAAWTGFSRD
jgi:hypothetical protein